MFSVADNLYDTKQIDAMDSVIFYLNFFLFLPFVGQSTKAEFINPLVY